LEAAGHEARFAAAWEMVAEAELFKGRMPANPDFKELLSIFNDVSRGKADPARSSVLHADRAAWLQGSFVVRYG